MMNSRKLIAFLLALVMLLSLAACAKDDNTNTNDDAVIDDTDNNTADDSTTNDDTTTDDTTSDDTVDTPADDETTDEPVEDDTTTDEPTEDDTTTDEPVENEPAPAEGPLNDFFGSLGDKYEMAMTMPLDQDMTDAYLPGLNDITLTESVLQTPMMSAVVCEILLVTCENADDAETVKGIFEARKQTQIDGGAWYPESIEVWEKAEIVVAGNHVALIAHPNASEIAADFATTFAE